MKRSPTSSHQSSRHRSREQTNSRDQKNERLVSSKNYSSAVLKMKETMRSELKNNKSSNYSEYEHQTPKKDYLSATEHLALSKAVKKIEEDGFQVSSFKSSTGNRNNKKTEDQAHDSVIFGPSWKSAQTIVEINRKNQQLKEDINLEAIELPKTTSAPMIPENMTTQNSERRNLLWMNYWKTNRNALNSI